MSGPDSKNILKRDHIVSIRLPCDRNARYLAEDQNDPTMLYWTDDLGKARRYTYDLAVERCAHLKTLSLDTSLPVPALPVHQALKLSFRKPADSGTLSIIAIEMDEIDTFELSASLPARYVDRVTNGRD